MSARMIHAGRYIRAAANRITELSASAFASGSVLLVVGSDGTRASTHLDVAGARALAASLIECADAIESESAISHPMTREQQAEQAGVRG